MDKNILVNLVKKEAAKFKLNATKDEIGNLDFSAFNPRTTHDCIYGLATGHCYSERAASLISKCCERIYRKKTMQELVTARMDGRPTSTKLNHRDYKYFSPIEVFISFGENQANGNNELLINYLKGKTKKLAFKKF